MASVPSPIATNDRRIDITTSLADPAFWAFTLSTSFSESWDAWGMTAQQADESFSRYFLSHWKKGLWPFFRLAVDDSRSVEIEHAEVDREEQQRVWVVAENGRRVLLGYNSPHFSFPSLRIPELLTIAARPLTHPAAPLLLLRGAYLSEKEKPPAAAIRNWLEQVPGIAPESTSEILSEILKSMVSGVRWSRDSHLGWINDSDYSQRNPKSTMSILEKCDFQFIESFFNEIAAR